MGYIGEDLKVFPSGYIWPTGVQFCSGTLTEEQKITTKIAYPEIHFGWDKDWKEPVRPDTKFKKFIEKLIKFLGGTK